MISVRNFIDGQFCDPDDDVYLDSYDPSTGNVWAKIPDSGASDAEKAVRAARTAFTRYDL
jgi:acyl-CoA reductase-like NAD-dependent aldehyde dehydrogenase